MCPWFAVKSKSLDVDIVVVVVVAVIRLLVPVSQCAPVYPGAQLHL